MQRAFSRSCEAAQVGRAFGEQRRQRLDGLALQRGDAVRQVDPHEERDAACGPRRGVALPSPRPCLSSRTHRVRVDAKDRHRHTRARGAADTDRAGTARLRGAAAARGAFWPPMPPTWPDARCGGTVPSLSVQRRSKSSCPSGRPKKTCTRSSEHGCTGASGRPSPVSPHPKSAGEECEAARASPVMSSATTQPIAHTSTGGPYAVPAKAYSGAVPGVRLGRVSRQAPRETDQLRGRGPAAAYLRTSACPANGRGRGR